MKCNPDLNSLVTEIHNYESITPFLARVPEFEAIEGVPTLAQSCNDCGLIEPNNFKVPVVPKKIIGCCP